MPEEVAKNIYRLPIPLPTSPLKTLNSYLIKGRKRNILIDTGFNHPECKRALLAELGALGAELSRIDVLLTHLHADHTGLAPEICVPGARIFLSRGEIPWMTEPTRQALWRQEISRMLAAGFTEEEVGDERIFATSRKMASNANFKQYRPIDEGDIFTCGDYILRAVLMPGHTPAHMCFWAEKQRIMFTGDHVLFDITPNITLWQNMDDPLGAYCDSLKKIDRFDVALALPGHRGTGDFHARIAYLTAHHGQRLEECRQLVMNNPGETIYQLAGKMSWKIHADSWADFPVSQKWFAAGECHSHLRRLERLGRIRAYDDCGLIRFEAV
jgi:glyoxylase-like metal-dependent hydrolase (beta-lactamase superfamily II)